LYEVITNNKTVLVQDNFEQQKTTFG